jgi:mannose-6-phosphate isomerase
MAGFRDPEKTAAILRGLEFRWLNDVADRLEDSITPFQTLHSVVTEMLAMEGPELAARLAELRSAALAAEKRSHARRLRKRRAEVDPSAVDRESTRVYASTIRLIDRYPADPGVLVTLLLNHVVLAAGEAMFIDAGVIHAYTSGFGVEIMAASDNVLRAGLTPKYVDKAELLEITNFTPMPPPRWASQSLANMDGELLAPPVGEFQLVVAKARLRAAELPGAAQIVLCLEGSVDVATDQDKQRLDHGQSVFVPATEGPVYISGSGRVAVSRPPV